MAVFQVIYVSQSVQLSSSTGSETETTSCG